MRHDRHVRALTRTHTLAEAPELTDASQQLIADGWPPFVLASPGAAVHWPRVLTEFADYQVVLVDGDDGAVVGIGHSLPLAWDGTVEGLPAGWDAALEQAIEDRDRGRTPTAAVGLSVTVATSHRGRHLSRQVVDGLRQAVAAHGHRSLVIPVRPNLKSAYPLTDIERYIAWTTTDGLPFDPWLRVHVRLGGRILAVCPESMRITGTVRQWEEWAGMPLPVTGPYVVRDALVPVHIDRERDEGVYVEPNVWVHHDLGGTATPMG
jgi:hypothetical protein